MSKAIQNNKLEFLHIGRLLGIFTVGISEILVKD